MSFWCYRCTRFVHVLSQSDDSITCPYCDSGFIEEIETQQPDNQSRPFPSATMYMLSTHRNRQDSDRLSSPRTRRNRRNRVPMNPVIVLRGSAGTTTTTDGAESSFELYYDDGVGSGLRPIPNSTQGSGFDRILEQLSNAEIPGIGLLGRPENPAASKAAMESMPTVQILGTHVESECQCAICKEEFELGSLVKEMPCKHIYHDGCIVRWLSMRNTCPVCRHEVAADQDGNFREEFVEGEGVGMMTLWRLPGGGFAVGRRGDREIPVVYTEMDGGGGGGSRSGGGGGNGLRRVLGGLLSFLRRVRVGSGARSRASSSSLSAETGDTERRRSTFNRYMQRHNRASSVLV
ncbi:DUF1117 domain-containing protein/zf-RING_2 domain-containing protein/zf-RING_3 domain-containing protein [Cephalotus follicularis]|uniref:RING-type E3 ubiquitin transferase n=1 Tax=Cephalotus follicularis TaxID=3775 RepID=A0A1Q3CDS8_CEPFO|nr:DUF1117 domain-containing protein/zf-RING_2 domain-containing protein/zf-RING_3 domain-containing protein [Cephalotus follicularis]